MRQLLPFLSIFSGASFLIYGWLCVFSGHMRAEFERYGLRRYRKHVGVLEILGGLGVLVGQRYSPPLFLFSASGLTLLMAAGVWVRSRVGDPLIQMIPAAALLVINALMAWSFATNS